MIKTNYNNIKLKVDLILNSISEPQQVKILAVSKTFPLSKVLEAYNIGIRDFGENYAQELKNKYDELDKQKYNDIKWHFIGHLQTNKVKYIAEFVDTIHSVDSVKLAKEISKQSLSKRENGNPIKIMVQVHTSNEETKSGINENELMDSVNEIIKLEGIKLIGLMTITTLTDEPKDRIPEFIILKKLLSKINNELNTNLNELSMGMSDDYEFAIKEGATIIRIGSAIFGERTYNQ